MKISVNCLPLTALFCSIYFFQGCKKEVIVNDLGRSFYYQSREIATGVTLGEVYNTRNFAAFTDIAYFNSTWYVVFRAGTKHIGGLSGQIKILKSTDARTWTVEHIIENDSLDLRDPKLVIDTLSKSFYLLYMGVKTEQNKIKVYNFLVACNSYSGSWSVPVIITNDNTNGEQFVFWRLTNFRGKMYCAAYRTPIHGGYSSDNLCLFQNQNNFESYITLGRFNLGGSPNEATIRFDENNKMYCLVRREVDNVSLGVAEAPPYYNVKWIDNPLAVRLASPNFLLYKGKLLITGRDNDERTFKFFCYNLSTNEIEKKFTFPSGKETGYGGMSFNPNNADELFISYYVIPGNESIIYLAKINLKTFLP